MSRILSVTDGSDFGKEAWLSNEVGEIVTHWLPHCFFWLLENPKRPQRGGIFWKSTASRSFRTERIWVINDR